LAAFPSREKRLLEPFYIPVFENYFMAFIKKELGTARRGLGIM